MTIIITPRTPPFLLYYPPYLLGKTFNNVFFFREVVYYRYLLCAPPNGWVWHKDFLRWVWVTDHSPDMPSIPKNASSPISSILHVRLQSNMTTPTDKCKKHFFFYFHFMVFKLYMTLAEGMRPSYWKLMLCFIDIWKQILQLNPKQNVANRTTNFSFSGSQLLHDLSLKYETLSMKVNSMFYWHKKTDTTIWS